MHKQGGVEEIPRWIDKTTSTQASRGPLLASFTIVFLTGWRDGNISRALLPADWEAGWASWVVSRFQCSCKQEPRRNRYLCLLSGHVKQSRPCLQGLGGAPQAYYLVLTFLSDKEINTTRVFPLCWLYVHTECTFSAIVSEFLLRCAPWFALQTCVLIWKLKIIMRKLSEVRTFALETRIHTKKNLLTWLSSFHTVGAGSIAIPVPLWWHILPEFIIWYYKDGHSPTMEIIFSFTMAPTICSGQGLSK